MKKSKKGAEKSKALVVSRILPKTDKYIPESWLRKFYEKVDDVRDKTYLMYHIETGLRVSDVLSTELVHVDWKNNQIHIQRTFNNQAGKSCFLANWSQNGHNF